MMTTFPGFGLRHGLLATGAAIIGVATATPAMAQTGTFNLPEQAASRGIPMFARQAGIQLLASGNVLRGRRTNAVRGAMSVEEGLRRLLAGTGLEASPDTGGTGIITVRAAAGASASGEIEAGGAAADSESAEIVVVGSRVRGAPPSSPVIRIDQAEMRRSGHNDLGEVARSIPQNFAGGQNPGVMPGSSAGSINNQNTNSASTMNLRGLGVDATLTLLNGRRLTYDGAFQAVDLSTIPLTAVDRIEVIADGASAIYGSDAVAGVVNVILRRDYDGVSTGVRLAAATEGGNFQQEYDLVAGANWGSGGIIASYRYSDNSAIFARQRDFTAFLRDPTTLFPANRQHSLLASVHQDIGSRVTLSADALYNWRRTSLDTSTATSRFEDRPETQSFALSATASVALGGDWTASLNGVLGGSDLRYLSQSYDLTGAPQSRSEGCNCNRMRSLELGGEGPLVELPGGTARLALGAGYRWNRFEQSSVTSDIAVGGTRESVYGFAELYAPLVGPAQAIPLVHRLSVTGALRYEDYADLGDVLTPKIGLIYGPTPDFDLRASWGRSFKAPTLLQQYQEYFAILYPASLIGGSGLPPTATALILTGGNPQLRPERATSWSATFALHPRGLAGFTAELSYFHALYRDRVLNPVANILTALSNPIYDEFVDRNPGAAAQQAAIAPARLGLLNFSGLPYDPAGVAAIVRNVNANAARQKIDAIDLLASYRHEAGSNIFLLNAGATWLWSRQRNSAASPSFDLAGTIYNPARFRARGGLSWTRARLTASAYLNWTGGVEDTRVPPIERIDGMATVDLSLVYSSPRGPRPLDGLDLVLAVQNLTDAEPAQTRLISNDLARYDSTNYSAIGRFVSVSLRKHW